MDWTNVVIDGSNDFDVQIVMELLDSEELATFQVEVTTRTPDFGLFNLEAPILSVREHPYGIRPAWLVTSWAGGALVREPHERLQLAANGWELGVPSFVVAQFWAFHYGNDPDSVLYCATGDTGGYAKKFNFAAAGDGVHTVCTIKNYPGDNIIAGARTYSLPYEPMIGCLSGPGGWYQAAREYKRWAESIPGYFPVNYQDRADASQTVLDADLLGSIGVDVEGINGVGDYTAVNTQISEWLAFLNDCSGLPDCDPGAVQFNEAIVFLQNWHGNQPGRETGWFLWDPPADPSIFTMLSNAPANVSFMPYFNPNRISDNDIANSFLQTLGSRDECQQIRTKADADGDPLTENTILDLSSQGVIDFLTDEVVNDLNALGWGGVFFDEWAQKDSRLEYAGNDGHPLGGGNFYATGIHQQVVDIRNQSRLTEPEYYFASEHISEASLDVLDLALENPPLLLFSDMVNPELTLDLFIAPINATIYNEYLPRSITLATDYKILPHEEVFFTQNWAIYFHYGFLPGINNFESDDLPIFPLGEARLEELYRFLQQMFRFYHFKKEFFSYGERMLDPTLDGISSVPHGDLWSEERRYWAPHHGEDSHPSVYASAWRDAAGKIAVALTNWTASSESFTFELDVVRDYEMPVQPSYDLYEEKETGRVFLGTFSTPTVSLSSTISEEFVRVFTIE